jgi:hypothetical protein
VPATAFATAASAAAAAKRKKVNPFQRLLNRLATAVSVSQCH